MRLVVIAAAIVFGSCLPTHPTWAACYQEVGCTDSSVFAEADLERLPCETLWRLRNTIFHERGYCFQTERGRASFSNARCLTPRADDLKLNRFERANVAAIVRVEKWLCESDGASSRLETRGAGTRAAAGRLTPIPQTVPAAAPPPPAPPPEPPREQQNPAPEKTQQELPEEDEPPPIRRGGSAAPEL